MPENAGAGAVLRHALDRGVSSPDAEDGDENRRRIQIQRSPRATLGTVRRRVGLAGRRPAAHSGAGRVSTTARKLQSDPERGFDGNAVITTNRS